MTDQYTLQDPRTQYETIEPPEQRRPEPALDRDLEPEADHGESSYRGTGRLTGRKALITGADSGIGRAVAIAFAREGASVALNYLTPERPDAQHVIDLLGAEGHEVVDLPDDLVRPDAGEDLVACAVAGLGGLDAVVNVAGKQQFVEDIEDLSPEQFDETFQVNVHAAYRIIRAAVPHLPAGSTIVNTSSIQAYKPSPGLVDYASTKATINTMSKALAQQLAPRGIRVNVVAPGPIWTPLQVGGGQPMEKLPHFGQHTPLGRAGQPAELAPAYVFLTSPESSYVLGETLNVNGGTPSP